MGDEADDILTSLSLNEEDSATFNGVKAKFDAYFIGSRNVIYERAKFNQRKQMTGEPVDSSSSSDCCAGQRSTPHSRTLEVRPGRITKKLGLRYDCDCERDETKSLLGVLMLGCDILIANDE